MFDARRINGQPKAVYHTVLAMDLRGNVTRALSGNGVETNNHFDPATGRLLTINSLSAIGICEVQDHHYGWDDLGNLMNRVDQSGSKNLTETFVYDDLNRLTSSQVSGKAAQTLQYDSLGNITHKSDVGNYTYGEHGQGPHAVTSTSDGVRYRYDANGNMLSDTVSVDGKHGGRTLKYTTFDKPYEIKKGDHTTGFKYGPDRARFMRTDTNASGTKVTRYIGGVEKITNPDNTQEIKRYIGSVLVTISIDSSGLDLGEAVQYLHKDHLGSVDVITDALGNIVQELSFDAWGQRRNAVNWDALAVASLLNFDHSNTTRGFTGHEMLDEVGLVHMNGRIYDARLGRFLQADTFVDGASTTQGYNRYSYVHNNPLNATDPTGHLIFSLTALALVAADVIAIELAFVAFGVASFADALVQGASLGEAFLAGISSAALSYFGGALVPEGGVGMNWQSASYVAKMGVIGGITSTLQGGRFGHGFVSAGLGASTRGIKFSGSASAQFSKRVVTAAVVGGTSSKISGGKFANGAAYGSFAAAVEGIAGWEELTSPDVSTSGKCSSRYGCATFDFEDVTPDDVKDSLRQLQTEKVIHKKTAEALQVDHSKSNLMMERQKKLIEIRESNDRLQKEFGSSALGGIMKKGINSVTPYKSTGEILDLPGLMGGPGNSSFNNGVGEIHKFIGTPYMKMMEYMPNNNLLKNEVDRRHPLVE